MYMLVLNVDDIDIINIYIVDVVLRVFCYRVEYSASKWIKVYFFICKMEFVGMFGFM